jgi:hypothetical protein
MIALMELAAARVMRPTPSQVSSRAWRSVEHRAPRRSEVACWSQTAARGKLYRFKVEVRRRGADRRGRHTRAIVTAERLLAGAAKRKP